MYSRPQVVVCDPQVVQTGNRLNGKCDTLTGGSRKINVSIRGAVPGALVLPWPPVHSASAHVTIGQQHASYFRGSTISSGLLAGGLRTTWLRKAGVGTVPFATTQYCFSKLMLTLVFVLFSLIIPLKEDSWQMLGIISYIIKSYTLIQKQPKLIVLLLRILKEKENPLVSRFYTHTLVKTLLQYWRTYKKEISCDLIFFSELLPCVII